MQTKFPFVEIPEELEAIVGKRDPGTRIYRRDGSQEESSVWFDLLTEIIGPSVSPGGGGMYEIRVLDPTGKLERTIPFSEADRKL